METSEEDPKMRMSMSHQNSSYEPQYQEAGLLLAMWSILVMNEGVVRFIQHGQPGAPNLFGGVPSRFWAPFLGGLFEVTFGLVVGLAGGVLGYFSRRLLLSLVVVQTILGWYVFVDYVLVIPAFRINSAPAMLNLSLAASKAFGVLGILTSIAWCLALQGGQFVFICRMLAFGGERDFLFQRSGAKARAIFWNVNYLLAGVWVTASGWILIANGKGGITTAPFSAPPNVGRIPAYLLFTGLLMIAWPLIGIAISALERYSMFRKYAVGSFFVFGFVWIHYTIGQLGFIAGNPEPSAGSAAGGALHNHLSMMLCFLPVYFMWKQAEEAGSSV